MSGLRVDHAVGQTRSIECAIEEDPSSHSWIALQESAGVIDPQHWPDYMTDPSTPFYFDRARTGDQFAATTAQDGMPTCFVPQRNLTGTFHQAASPSTRLKASGRPTLAKTT